MSTWRAAHTRLSGARGRPVLGDVVAYDRRAWEVAHVSDADPTPDEEDRLALYVPPWREEMRPYRVTLRRVHGSPHERENSRQEIGLRIPVAAYDPLPVYQDARVPLCSCHSEPWPCQEADQQHEAEAAMAKVEREMRLLPGCCPACEEPVTSRQKSITFGGPNVRNPFAEGPTFHLRRKCYGSAASYEDAWVADEPGRPRSLLTLACAGTVIVHEDGTGECFGAAESDCPSIYAKHRGYSACYYQSHGCGRGCTSRRHGCHPAGRPSDPREVTR